MKISNVSASSSNTQSFKRVVRLLNSNGENLNVSNRTLGLLGAVLNSNLKSNLYSQDEQKKIRSAFSSILGDYDGVRGIMIKKTPNGNIYAISGNDSSNLLPMQIQISNLKNKPLLSKQHKDVVANIVGLEDKIFKKISKFDENGRSGKPESSIRLSFDVANSGNQKLSEIGYITTTTEYSQFRDGTILDKFRTVNRPKNKNCATTVNCTCLNYLI